MIKFSDQKIEKELKNLSKSKFVLDSSGLYLLFRKNNKKNNVCKFCTRVSVNKVAKTIIHGTYGLMSLDEAREKHLLVMKSLDSKRADEFLLSLNAGTAFIRTESFTLKQAFDEYMQKCSKELTASTLKQYQFMYNNYISKLDSIPLKMIDLNIIRQHFLNDLINNNKIETARVCGTVLSKLFKYYIANSVIDNNPVQYLSTILPKVKTEHRATLNLYDYENEMIKFFAKLKTCPIHKQQAVLFYFYSLLRKVEPTSVLQGDIYNDYVVVKTKRIEEFRLPLTRQIKNFIKSNGLYAFENNIGTIAYNTIYELCKGDFTLHGIRTLGKHYFTCILKCPEAVSEYCLAHNYGDKVYKAYTRTDFLEQRQEAMQCWSDYVDELFSKS